MRKLALSALPLAALLVPLAVPAASAEPASTAATCSGAGCDDLDPARTGCDDSAITVDTVSSSKGTFKLRYSTTCKTNWLYVGNYAGGSDRSDGKLEMRVEDHDRAEGFSYYASSAAGTHWSNMIYSPGDNCGIGAADWNYGDWDAVVSSSGC